MEVKGQGSTAGKPERKSESAEAQGAKARSLCGPTCTVHVEAGNTDTGNTKTATAATEEST
jgi:hypothetical protein